MATVCGSVGTSSVSCTGAHWPFIPCSWACHSSSVLLLDRLGDELRADRRVLDEQLVGGEARVVDVLRDAEPLAHLRPVVVALQHAQREEPAVLGLVDCTSGLVIWPTVCAASSCHGMPASSDTAMPAPIAHMPVPSSDTSTTSASPVRSRWNSAAKMPPAMVMAPIESPNAGAGMPGTVVASGAFALMPLVPRSQNRASRSRPRRRRGRARRSRAPHVDDVRVVGADVVDVDLQLLADARHLVGEEDVGDRGELVEDVAPLVLVEVEAEALLAAVGVLEEGDTSPAKIAMPVDARPRAASPRVTCSILMTSAPQSARRADAAGTKVCSATSRMRMPSMGRCVLMRRVPPGIRTQSKYGRQVNARHDPEPRAAPYALQ